MAAATTPSSSPEKFRHGRLATSATVTASQLTETLVDNPLALWESVGSKKPLFVITPRPRKCTLSTHKGLRTSNTIQKGKRTQRL